MAHYVCTTTDSGIEDRVQVESSMVASSLAGRWSLAQAREEGSLLGLGSAKSGSVGGRNPRCASATRSASCLLLVGDSSLLVFLPSPES
jgi:hypothetical protein